MEKHITLVAVLNIGFGIMGLLLARLAFAKASGLMACTSIVAQAIAILVIILFVLEIIGGIRLLIEPSPKVRFGLRNCRFGLLYDSNWNPYWCLHSLGLNERRNGKIICARFRLIDGLA